MCVHHLKHLWALFFGVYDIDYLLYNAPTNETYKTFPMKMKINEFTTISEYHPKINVPTAPVRIWLQKLRLWYGKHELNSFDNHGYQSPQGLECDLRGFYEFYTHQRYFETNFTIFLHKFYIL